MHWINNAVIYNIYPLGCCGAPKENDFKQEYRLDRIYGFIPHLKKMGCGFCVVNFVFIYK
jgi:hypothetical protein